MNKTYQFQPKGVCSHLIEYTIDENNILTNVKISSGCPGNTMGVCKLAKGHKCEDIIKMLKNIDCKGRGTSCPDQLAKGLELILKGEIKPL